MTDTAASPVNALAERTLQAYLELSPTMATLYGDERYADQLEDPSPQGRARKRALWQQVLGDAGTIVTDGLAEDERITLPVLKGLPRRRVLGRHVLRNSLIPLVTILAPHHARLASRPAWFLAPPWATTLATAPSAERRLCWYGWESWVGRRSCTRSWPQAPRKRIPREAGR